MKEIIKREKKVIKLAKGLFTMCVPFDRSRNTQPTTPLTKTKYLKSYIDSGRRVQPYEVIEWLST